MNDETNLAVIAGIGILLVGVLLFLWRRRRPMSSHDLVCTNRSTPGTRIVFGPNDTPLVEIFRQQVSENAKRDDLPLIPRFQTGLQSLLAQAPVVAASGAIATSQTFVMRFAPEVAKGLTDGTLSMMQSKMIEGGIRASALGADGAVVGQATLLAASGVNIAATGIVVWQLLAFVTAQKYLVDINARLAKIEGEIRSIKQWLEDERIGKLLGNLAYMQSRARDLIEQDLSESRIATYDSQLEQIVRECHQTMETLQLQMESEANAFSKQPLTGGAFTVGHSEKAREQISSLENFARQFLLAMYVRTLAHQLMCALPVNRQMVLNNMEDLHQQHVKFRDRMNDFQQLAERRIPELKGRLTFPSVDSRHQEQMKGHIVSVSDRLLQLWQGVDELATRTKDAIRLELASNGEPLTLAVTLDSEGKVSRLEKLSFDSAERD